MKSENATCSYEGIHFENNEEEFQSKLTWHNLMRQIMVCSTLWTFFFVYGLQLGAPTVLIPQLKNQTNFTTVIDDGLTTWITSMYSFGAFPWLIILPIQVHMVGRRKTYLFITIYSFIGAFVIYLSTTVTQLLIGEFMLGILLAAIVTISPLIMTECSSPKYRGIFLTIKSASGFWGMWVANIIGTFWHWKNIYILALVCILSTLLTFAWPESPYWLAKKKRFRDCAISHRNLKGATEDAEKELSQLINYFKTKQNNHNLNTSKPFLNCFRSFISIILCREFYKPLCLAILLGCSFHMMGKIICSVYALQILERITGNKSTAYNVMLIIDGVSVLGAYCGSVLSKFCKRRTILFSTSILSIVMLYTLSLYLFLIYKSIINEINFVSISLLSIFSVSVCSGPMILVSSIYGEIISFKYQLITSIIYGCVTIMVMTVSVKASFWLFRTITLPGTFLFFAISSSIIILLLYLYLPETKNKTMQEIQKHFKTMRKCKSKETILLQNLKNST